MPSISVSATYRTDSPAWPDLADKIAAHITDTSESWRLVVLNAGMTSRQPSVGLAIPVGDGEWIVAETSLLAFLAAATVARGMAETRFGWEMPA